MFKLTGIGHLNGRVPLIRQGENLASNLEITLPIDYQGYTYNVITKVNTDPPIYSPPITPVNNILIFPIIIDFTRHDGTITFELLASTAQGIVAKTSKVTYPIVKTLTEQDDEAPDPYSHWLTGLNGAFDEAIEEIKSDLQKIKADEKAEKKAKKLVYEELIAENKAATTVTKLNAVMDKLLKELGK